MATAAPRRMTVAEFLAWDDGTDTRYELIDGRPVAMAPVRARDSRIVGNLARHLGNRLKPPCGVYTEAGIVLAHRDDAYYEADLAVSCASLEGDPGWVPEPMLIAEVLSPSTADRDRLAKLADYRRLPSVCEILIVSGRERRVELLRREGGRWVIEDLIGEAELRPEAVGGAAIPLAAVYEGTGTLGVS